MEVNDLAYRLPEGQDAQRLFHGRGHAYPGWEHVCIDWLAPVVLITLYQPIDRALLEVLAEKLFTTVPNVTSVQVQARYESGAPIECLLGDLIEMTEVSEGARWYRIELGKNQNNGLFLDMRKGRDWLQKNASGQRVLNLFAYTCAFSVAALAGGASKVVNIDMSRASLSKGRENHRLNEHDLSKVVFEGVDIFKSFGRIKKHGPYDVVVCDPPSFQKGSVDIKRDYKKIIRRLPQWLTPGAKVMLCLNSPDLDDDFLRNTVQQECPQCRYVTNLDTPEVFVEAEAGRGLKVQIYQYETE